MPNTTNRTELILLSELIICFKGHCFNLDDVREICASDRNPSLNELGEDTDFLVMELFDNDCVAGEENSMVVTENGYNQNVTFLNALREEAPNVMHM